MIVEIKSGPPLVILGAGGHAKVLLSLLQAAGLLVMGVCDPVLFKQKLETWRGVKVLGGDEFLETLDPTSVGLVNGIGQTVGSSRRREVYEQLIARGFHFPALVHPHAWVDPTVDLRDGVQVMAGAVVQADTVVGQNTIINTRASLDHDCCVDAHVHIAPGATLCGSVKVGAGAFIACGSTVIQGLTIGEDAVVGAGAVLVRDLLARLVLLGPVARNKPVSGE
ncbi:acetyltransferase [Pseudomonas sp. LB3P81]